MSVMERRVLLLPDQATSSPLLIASALGELHMVSMTLTTDATVGNRQYCLTWTDKNGVVKTRIPTASVPAGGVVVFSFGVGFSYSYTANVLINSLPLGMLIEQGDVVSMDDISAISAGDRFANTAAVFNVAR